MNIRTLCILILFIVFTISSVIGQVQKQEVKQTPDSLLGKALPIFSGTSLRNIRWDQGALKGKVALINFWFIGCMPCMKEINHLNKIHRDYQGKDFILISIVPQLKEDLIAFNDTTRGNTYSGVRKMFKANPIEYEILPVCDTRRYINTGKDTSIGVECDAVVKDFYVIGFPTTFIVDKKGMVRHVNSGFVMDEAAGRSIMDKYREIIEGLLKE